MRVKVIFNKLSKDLRIPALLKMPHKRISSNFIIDTGSPHTILNYTDSIRLGIPHFKKAEIVRLGGKAYQSFIYEKLEIILKSINNEEIKENIPVRVLKPFSSKIDEIENLDRLPNLLGIDFLEKFKFICNIPEKEIFLEKQ